MAEACLNKQAVQTHGFRRQFPSSARCHGRAGCSTAGSSSRNAGWFEALGTPENCKQVYGNLHQFTTIHMF